MQSTINIKSGNALKNFITLAGVLIVILIVAYSFGYRITRQGIVKVTNISVESLPESSEIYIDNVLQGTYSGNTMLSVVPGPHSIIITKAGYWPYVENITAEKGSVNVPTVKPFLIAQNPEGKLIGSQDPEFATASSLFFRKLIPTESSKLKSPNNLVSIHMADGKIFATSEVALEESLPVFRRAETPETIEIFDPVTEVRNIAFYKDRDDVLILAIQDGVFALELDPAVTQNLQPIYEGSAPDFRKNEDGSIYVKDKNVLTLINL